MPSGKELYKVGVGRGNKLMEGRLAGMRILGRTGRVLEKLVKDRDLRIYDGI